MSNRKWCWEFGRGEAGAGSVGFRMSFGSNIHSTVSVEDRSSVGDICNGNGIGNGRRWFLEMGERIQGKKKMAHSNQQLEFSRL